MRKQIKRVLCLLCAMITVFAIPLTAFAAGDGNYTYGFNYWGEIQESPDPYAVKVVLDWQSLGLDKDFKQPKGMFIKDNYIYICDTGNNRIVIIEYTADHEYRAKRTISTIYGTEVNYFNTPTDIFVDDDYNYYIADSMNFRIVEVDKNLNFIKEFTKPEDSTFDQQNSFMPIKLVVDAAGRVYTQVTSGNKGLMKFENDTTFTGYIGASKVIYTAYQYFWRIFSTKEQRARMEQLVPTEYENVAIDEDGFMYVVTSKFEVNDLRSGDAMPVRRLNTMGSDILVRNGYEDPIGDVYWGLGGGYTGPSLFGDITPMENYSYAVLDKNRGKIFMYDSQGNLLYCFGGNGNVDGYFRQPTALDHMGRDLYVLDGIDGYLTVFTPTEYGTLVYEAIDIYLKGDYDKSAELWEQVLALNGNYDLAYVGVGRAQLRQSLYKEAMANFKLKYDRENYSKAFQLYRKYWVEDNIFYIVVALIVIIAVPLTIDKVKKAKMEVRRYEQDEQLRQQSRR